MSDEHGHGGGHEEDGHDSGHEDASEEHGESHEEEHGNDEEHGGHAEHKGDGHAEEKHEEKPKPAVKKKKSITESEVFILLAIAVLGRVLLKVTPLVNIPSVEPIIPIAVYAGLAYGTDAGIIVGLLAYPVSNIFLPGGIFGLWLFWQAVGGAVAGGIAGLAKKANFNNIVGYTVLGTVLFELAVNLPDQGLLIWPFSFVHIISNFVFAALIGLFVLKEK